MTAIQSIGRRINFIPNSIIRKPDITRSTAIAPNIKNTNKAQIVNNKLCIKVGFVELIASPL
jgi:hypothetical protein